MRRIDATVLMGPPGSGKTHLGRLLATRGVVTYRELENELVARFGTDAEFAQRKPEALVFLRDTLNDLLNTSAIPVLIETTGVSDSAMLRDFSGKRRLLWIALVPPRQVCVDRVARRAAGRNLNNNVSHAAGFYDFWMRSVRPQFSFDLELDGLESEADAAAITWLIERT